MVRELYDEQGNAVSVPDEAEVTALQTKVAEAEAAKASWEEEKKKLSEEVNPNWAEMRKKEQAWNKREKEYEKQIQDLGGKKPETSLTREEVEQLAEKKANEMSIRHRKEDLLQEYGQEEAKVIEHYFTKLSAGEELTPAKVEKFMKDAERAAGIGRNPTRSLSGRPPVYAPAESVTDAQREIAHDLGINEKELQNYQGFKPPRMKGREL